MAINRDTGILDIAVLVSEALEAANIYAVLSGGAAVSIYTANQYESYDLDFVSSASPKEIGKALRSLGYTHTGRRYFTHTHNPYVLEFPAGPLALGDRIVKEAHHYKTPAGRVHMLTPTQSAMDRLCHYFYFNDPQGLEQAVAIAGARDVDFDGIRAWAKDEGQEEKYKEFLGALQKSGAS